MLSDLLNVSQEAEAGAVLPSPVRADPATPFSGPGRAGAFSSPHEVGRLWEQGRTGPEVQSHSHQATWVVGLDGGVCLQPGPIKCSANPFNEQRGEALGAPSRAGGSLHTRGPAVGTPFVAREVPELPGGSPGGARDPLLTGPARSHKQASL